MTRRVHRIIVSHEACSREEQRAGHSRVQPGVGQAGAELTADEHIRQRLQQQYDQIVCLLRVPVADVLPAAASFTVVGDVGLARSSVARRAHVSPTTPFRVEGG